MTFDYMKKNKNTIKAYCTVDSSRVSQSGSTYHCDKCNKNLVNLNDSTTSRSNFSKAGGLVCGIFATVAISSCSTIIEEPVGIFYSPQDFDSKGDLYPSAQAVEGEEGIVISPYGGHRVDVSKIPADSLVIDPHYSAEELKLFRI